jgi:hypothetical protein
MMEFMDRIGVLTDEELGVLEDAIQARVEALEVEREVAGDKTDKFVRLLAWEKARRRLVKEERLRRVVGMELPYLP